MEYLLHILVMCGIYSILALSLNLVVGYTGLVSIGHASFFCVGAYVSALLSLNAGLSPWVGLVAGGCGGALLGVVVGAPSLRLKGDYLALATFGSGVVVYQIAKNWVSLTRGPMGLPGIPPFPFLGFSLDSTWSYLLLVVAATAMTVIVVQRLVGSPYGRVLRSVREDETASMALGKHTAKYKFQVFVVGALFAGVAGSLYAHYITFIDPSSFTVMESITVLLMVIFGGMATIKGSLVGATTLVAFPEALRFLGMPSAIAAPTRQMIYGLLLIILMIKKPQGLFGKYRFR